MNRTSAEVSSEISLRTRLDLFLISVLILFLEPACIRWFPAHVLFLLSVNVVHLPFGIQLPVRNYLEQRLDVGDQLSPQFVYFDAEYGVRDVPNAGAEYRARVSARPSARAPNILCRLDGGFERDGRAE